MNSIIIICPVCSGKFISRLVLKEHIRTKHEGKLTFDCRHCENVYCKYPTLLRHSEQVHGEKKQFSCDICKKGHTNMEELSDHFLAAHKQFRIKNKITKTIECHSCLKKFRKMAALKNHCNEMHQHIVPHVCFQCRPTAKTFQKPSQLADHLIKGVTKIYKPRPLQT